MGFRRDDDRAVSRNQRGPDITADRIDQVRVVLIELDEMLGLLDPAPVELGRELFAERTVEASGRRIAVRSSCR
jgi:hypothetical protein